MNQWTDWSEILSVKISAWMRTSLLNTFCRRNNFYYTKLSTRRFSISIPFSFCLNCSFWFFSSFLAKSISFYFRNQIYTALGFQKYSHCNKVLYISPWTIPFYTSDVSLLTKKSLIFAIFYKGESGVLLKYAWNSQDMYYFLSKRETIYFRKLFPLMFP